MALLDRPAIYTDYYELTMAQGYFLSGRGNMPASFDYFFRDNPFNGGYVVFAGISDLAEQLDNLNFAEDELEYLEEQGFHEDFIEYLRNFTFSGTIYAAREGEVVFPREPMVRVQGTIVETQLIETLLLNLLNFESLIATKAARMRQVAGDRKLLDFGLRRSQGLGGIQASKAAVIGGFEGTSNVYSAFQHHLEASGTMAHSWVQSFDDEITAFRKYAQYYPDSCVLLVDTYDTLKSGVPNAIKVAKELEKAGHRMVGVRLDSGDLAYFAREARKQLDDAGLDYVKIAASNQLDEYLIKSLIDQQAPIDLFGVGTRLVTGHESPALDGVYKLSSIDGRATLKISENIEKITLPGLKKVYRYYNGQDMFYRDGIGLEDEADFDYIYHPHFPAKRTQVKGLSKEPLLKLFMDQGKLADPLPTAKESAKYARQRLSLLHNEHKRFENPHVYKVGISKKLMDLRDKLIETENQGS